jgi:hypothetical protein
MLIVVEEKGVHPMLFHLKSIKLTTLFFLHMTYRRGDTIPAGMFVL